jgi:peptidoglycan hydrolase FlgJ
MSTLQPTTQGLAADPGALNALKYSAAREGDGGKGALKEAAKQFESLFMRELIKSMRDATQKSGLLEGQGSDLGTDLLDQQLSVHMSGMPGGLSEMIARQLSQQTAPAANGAAAPEAPARETAKPLSIAPTGPVKTSSSQAEFVQRHSAAAARVEKDSGLPSGFMLGQAGHETGWGRSEIRMKGGAPSHNLFGIKAGPGWKGPVAEITTTEFEGGQARKVTAKFRSYASTAESFADYAKLMKESPRYAGVVANAASPQGFAQGLQRAGYATDPAYADKLTRMINTTLRLQRAVT